MTDDPRTDDPQDGVPTEGVPPPGAPPVGVPPVGAPQNGDAPAPNGPIGTAPDAAAPIAAPTVEYDLPCVGCGYNLRSILVSGMCPECGVAVADSFAHGWLVFADRAWLKTLRGGFAKILWTILAAFLSYIAMIPIFMLALGGGSSAPEGLAVLFGVAACTLLTWMWIKGLWAVTCRQPSQSGEVMQTSMVAWIRGLSVAAIVGFVLLAIVETAALWTVFGTQVVLEDGELFQPDYAAMMVAAIAIPVLGVIAQAAFAVSLFLLLIHLRRLARRDPRPGLAKMMTFLVWGSIGVSGAGFASVALVGLAMFSLAAMPMAMAPTSLPATMAPTTSPAIASTYQFSVSAGSPTVMSPTTMTATTMSATSMPFAAPPPGRAARMFPFRGPSPILVEFVAIAVELLIFAWCICALIALFWFRRVLQRAIDTRRSPAPIAKT